MTYRYEDKQTEPDQLGHKGRMLDTEISDTVDFDPIPKAIRVMTGGRIRYIPYKNGNTETGSFVEADVIDITVADGTMLDHIVRRVLATDTDASGMYSVED